VNLKHKKQTQKYGRPNMNIKLRNSGLVAIHDIWPGTGLFLQLHSIHIAQWTCSDKSWWMFLGVAHSLGGGIDDARKIYLVKKITLHRRR